MQGTKTSLRYALQMISSSHLLAKRRHSGRARRLCVVRCVVVVVVCALDGLRPCVASTPCGGVEECALRTCVYCEALTMIREVVAF
jgi:hypothetical protein